jgi:hypothetical protein
MVVLFSVSDVVYWLISAFWQSVGESPVCLSWWGLVGRVVVLASVGWVLSLAGDCVGGSVGVGSVLLVAE